MIDADKLRALEFGSRVLHDNVYDEARTRHINDATQSGYDHHVVRVAAEHGAQLAILALTEEVRVLREENQRLTKSARANNDLARVEAQGRRAMQDRCTQLADTLERLLDAHQAQAEWPADDMTKRFDAMLREVEQATDDARAALSKDEPA